MKKSSLSLVMLLLASTVTYAQDTNPCAGASHGASDGQLNFDGSCTFDNPSVLIDGQMLQISDVPCTPTDSHPSCDRYSLIGFCALFGRQYRPSGNISDAGGGFPILNADGSLNMLSNGEWGNGGVWWVYTDVTCK